MYKKRNQKSFDYLRFFGRANVNVYTFSNLILDSKWFYNDVKNTKDYL